MTSRGASLLAVLIAACCAHSASGAEGRDAKQAMDRALAFLTKEVPQWPVENRCFSCHNNGDAARALYAAVRGGRPIEPSALETTTAWLRRPEGWEHNGGEGEFSDRKLAAVQFSAALLDALRTDRALGAAPLKQAATLVAGFQDDDGAWSIDAPGVLGSPTTYGRTLATATALRVLKAADDPRHRPRIDKAEAWLRGQRPRAVLDAAATLLALAGADDSAAVEQCDRCRELLLKAQGESGGWGPYAASPPEPFDTAVALLALVQHNDGEHRRAIQHGRRYLVESQLDDGSWPETTRPAHAISYAQRLSTTGWATQALLATAAMAE